MKVRVRYAEHTYREAVIEAESVDVIRTHWLKRYDSVVVDAIEDASVEVDGGIIWDSAVFEELK
jgi:hypothetical protein